MNVIKDITGWRGDLKAMHEDGRFDAVFRDNDRCGIVGGVREGVRPKTPLSHLKTYVDTLLTHNELRPALEAFVLFDMLTTLGKEPDYDEVAFPHQAQELLSKFENWYVVRQELCPGPVMTECYEVAAALISQGIKSACDTDADPIFHERIHMKNEVDFSL